MTGILLLGVAGIWFVAVLLICATTARNLPKRPWRYPLVGILFLGLITLPLVDEIVGGYQFKLLCDRYAVQYIDEQYVRGRRVLSVPSGSDKYAEGTVLKIRIAPWVYRDADTGRILVSYHTLHASGGWFIRVLGISETKRPLIFESSCAPANERAFIKKYDVTIVN